MRSPTEKQFLFLEDLGYQGPEPKTLIEASDLIDELKAARKKRRSVRPPSCLAIVLVVGGIIWLLRPENPTPPKSAPQTAKAPITKPVVKAIPAQTPAAHKPLESEYGKWRTWVATGTRHTTDALLVAVEGDSVRLQKRNGKKVKVALNKLSETDREHVRKANP